MYAHTHLCTDIKIINQLETISEHEIKEGFYMRTRFQFHLLREKNTSQHWPDDWKMFNSFIKICELNWWNEEPPTH